MIDRIAKVICPEAFDRDAFRRIVKESNGGHTAGIDIAASMQQARDAAKAKAQEVWAAIRRPTGKMLDMGGKHFKLSTVPDQNTERVASLAASGIYEAMIDAELEEEPSPRDRMETAVTQVLHNPATSKPAKTPAGRV